MEPDDDALRLLSQRMSRAGFGPVIELRPATGGTLAVAAVAVLADGQTVFAKTLLADRPDLFEVEAEGLRALRDPGRARVPDVLHAGHDLLVLEPLRPLTPSDDIWEQLAERLAVLHAVTSDRFGWHQDGWLGRLRQENTWHDDGHRFFAERRLLRWLREPLIEQTFDAADRRALERLCERLPELVPDP